MSAIAAFLAHIMQQSGGAWVSSSIVNGPATNDWRYITGSGTNQYLMAASTGGVLPGIHVSADYGATWSNPNTSGGPSAAMCLSYSGQYQFFCISSTIWRSSNYGSTFSNIYTIPQGASNHMNCSPDGKNVWVGGANGKLNYSTDFGATWTALTVGGGSDIWNSVCVSSDGTKIFVAAQGAGTGPVCALSTNTGGSWSVTTLPSTGSNTGSFLACCSDNFAKIFVGNANTGLAWISTDSGANFNPTLIDAGGSGVYGITCSADGLVVFFVDQGNYIYKSSDGGFNWKKFSTRQISWRGGHVSADGTRFVTSIASTGGGLWQAVYQNTY